MFVRKYKPDRFSDIIGSSFAKKIIKEIVKSPINSPRSLIFFGPPGIGKTSSARIFSKKLNSNSDNYYEFNCAVFGNIKVMRDIRETLNFSFTSDGEYRVVVFDEIQLSSPEAQNFLLEVLDNSDLNTFFVFCTTDINQVIPTLVSRSVEIEFEPPSDLELLDYLSSIVVKEAICVSEEAVRLIVNISTGDVRHALNKLQECVIVGEADFIEKYSSLDKDISEIIEHSIYSELFDVNFFEEKVLKVLNNPIRYIRNSFENYIISLSDDVFVKGIVKKGRVDMLIYDWLKLQGSLKTRGDWNVYFNTIRKYAEKREKVGDRFQRKD